MNNNQENNKYCDAMNMVHAPDSLVRKVRNMNRQSKIKTFKARKVGYVAAALAAVFVSSNAVSFAATGSTWVEKIVVKINGVEQDVDAEHTTYIEDGTEYDSYTIEVDENESNSMSFELTDEIPESNDAEAPDSQETQTQEAQTPQPTDEPDTK